jgi:hypothetical protein
MFKTKNKNKSSLDRIVVVNQLLNPYLIDKTFHQIKAWLKVFNKQPSVIHISGNDKSITHQSSPLWLAPNMYYECLTDEVYTTDGRGNTSLLIPAPAKVVFATGSEAIISIHDLKDDTCHEFNQIKELGILNELDEDTVITLFEKKHRNYIKSELQ